MKLAYFAVIVLLLAAFAIAIMNGTGHGVNIQDLSNTINAANAAFATAFPH